MRTRLRPAYGPDQLAVFYAVPHRHVLWPDHQLRVAETIRLARELCSQVHGGIPDVIADLSAGDGAIASALAAESDGTTLLLMGDLAPGWGITGPIEQTITRVSDAGLFICTETIEHLDDPDTVLAAIRARARALVLSTPVGETDAAINAEHYWGWDHDGVRDLLAAASWDPVLQRDVTWTDPSNHVWACQLWGCR